MKLLTNKTLHGSTSVGMHIDGSGKRSAALLFKVLIAAAASGCSVLAFYPVVTGEFFTLGELVLPVMLITAAVSLVIFGASVMKKGGGILLSVFIAAAALLVYRLRESAGAGLMYCFNSFCDILNARFMGMENYDLSGFSYDELRVGVFALVCFSALTVSVAAGVFFIYRSFLPPAVISVFFLPELALYFGLVPNYICVAMVFAFIASLMAAEFAEPSASVSLRRDPSYVKASGHCAAAAAAAFLLCFGIAAAGVSMSDFERTPELKAMRRNISQYLSTFSLKKFRNDIAAYADSGEDSIGATNHGKLGRTDDVTFTEDEMLRVTLPKRRDNVYLRDFIGAEYTGNSWNELSVDEQHRLEELSEGFSQEGFSPLFIDGFNIEMIDGGTGMFPREKMLIERKGAPGRGYMPYFMTPDLARTAAHYGDKADIPADGSAVEVYNVPSYFMESIVNGQYRGTDTELIHDENIYRKFAYETYLQIPETFNVTEKIYEGYDFLGLEAELYAIKDWLTRNCEYSLSAGKLPFGKDFAQYFMAENRKGSCSHFATAAVLMCRYRGIPARYAEGFIIKAEDFPFDKAVGENVTVELTDQRAHAWAEIYVDGYGWMAFEATPGYGSAFGGAESFMEPEFTHGGGIAAEMTPMPETVTLPDITEATFTEPSADAVTESETETETETETTTERSEESEEGPAEESETGPDKDKSVSPVIVVFAVIGAAALGVVAVFAVRYKNITSARARRLKSRNTRKKAGTAGKYFVELCAYKNVKKEDLSPFEDFAAYAEENIPELRKGSAAVIIKAALEASYSGTRPSDEDADQAAIYAMSLSHEIFKGLKGGERFVFKYIRCLL